jgi:hypothetical protein
MPRAPFYDHPLLKAYVLFDVSKGREQRREGGGSLSNRVRVVKGGVGGSHAKGRRWRGWWKPLA